MLLNNRMLFLVVHYWEVMVDVWPVIVKVRFLWCILITQLQFSLFLLCDSLQVIIITLFKSQGYLAEHNCSTNWGDHKSTEIRTNQIKCWFLSKGENQITWGKTFWCRVENQQTQPTYGVKSKNLSRATFVGGECSHHCASSAPSSPIQTSLPFHFQDRNFHSPN